MNEYTKAELEEARFAIESTLKKCEKVQEKLKQGSPQATLTIRRIKAFQIAIALIDEQLEL